MDGVPLALGLGLALLGCATLALTETGRSDPLATPRLLALYLLLAYAADPLMIALSGRYGFDAKHWWWMGGTSSMEVAAVAALGGMFALAIALGTSVKPGLRLHRIVGLSPTRTPSRQRLALALIVSGVISVGAIVAAFAAQLSSVEGIVALVGYKQSVFAGRGYLLLLALLFKAVVLLWTVDVFRRAAASRSEWLMWWGAVIAMAMIDLSTGTRSNLLFANVLVLVHLWHKIRKPLPVRALLLGGTAVLVFAVVIRVVTRDIAFSENRGRSVTEIATEEFRGLAENLLFDEVQGADAQLLVMTNQLDVPPRFHGATIAAAFIAPVPRALMPSKPRGGNAEFTNWYFPRRYQTTRVEYAVSLVTELWMNGRLAFLLLGGLALGALCKALEFTRDRAAHPVVIVMQSVMVWRMISLVRGDTFNWFINLTMISIALIIAYVAISRPFADAVHRPAT